MHTHRHLPAHGKLGIRVLLLFAAGLLVAPGSASAQNALGLSPMLQTIDMTPGQTRNSTIVLGNDDKQASRFRTELLDFSVDQEATPQFERDIPQEAQFSCKQWLTVNPMEGEVQPSAQLPVRYSLQVPADAPPRTYHCAIGFTGLGDPRRAPQASAIGILSSIRIVSTLYVTIGKSVPQGVIKKIELEQVLDQRTAGYRAIFSVENSGLTNLRGSGKIDILAADAKVVETVDFPPVVILPRRTQRLPVVFFKKLAEGTYTVRARANIGTGEIQEASISFRFPADIPISEKKPAGAAPVNPASPPGPPSDSPLPGKP